MMNALRLLLPPSSPVTRGVGMRFRCAAHFCMLGAIIFAVAVGVGKRAIRASDGLIAAPELADWLLPYWLAVGIGSNDQIGRAHV